MTSSYLVSVSCLGAAALTFVHITDWGNDALGKRHLHFSCTNIHAVLQLYEHPTPPFFCVTGKLVLFKSVVANILRAIKLIEVRIQKRIGQSWCDHIEYLTCFS